MEFVNSGGVHKGSTKSVSKSHQMSVNITADLLKGCEHKCPGCFVDKDVPFLTSDISQISNLVDQMDQHNLDFNELFLGPTDIFSASNFDDIITNPEFTRLSKHFTLTCITTGLNDPTETARRLKLLDEHNTSWKERDFEIFVVLDIPKFSEPDQSYMDLLESNLQLFEMNNVFFIQNMYSPNMFDSIDLQALNQAIRDKYNSKLRINPSYFLVEQGHRVEKYAAVHRKVMEQQINQENVKDIFNNMIDTRFAGFTFINLAFSNHELFVMPFIYEAIPITDDLVNVKKPINDANYQLTDVFDCINVLFEEQYEYSYVTKECNHCKYLASCVSRNVLSYMETRDIQNCIVPKSLLQEIN